MLINAEVRSVLGEFYRREAELPIGRSDVFRLAHITEMTVGKTGPHVAFEVGLEELAEAVMMAENAGDFELLEYVRGDMNCPAASTLKVAVDRQKFAELHLSLVAITVPPFGHLGGDFKLKRSQSEQAGMLDSKPG